MNTVEKPKVEKSKLQPPGNYQVILLNDDYTPMDFVVLVLQKFFSVDLNKATKIMMQIHTEGKAICGVYSKDIAETRKTQINEFAKNQKHILKSIVERAN